MGDTEYLLIFIIISVIFIFSILLFGLSYLFNFQTNHFAKLSAYECGFIPFDDSRGEFNIVGILFVIFDLEIVFLFPLCVSLNLVGFFGVIIALIFLIILTIGFLYEWVKGGLEW